MKTALHDHLARYVIENLTDRNKAVARASNFALWHDTYGPTVADKVMKICSDHWKKKGLPSVPFHPVLVSLFKRK